MWTVRTALVVSAFVNLSRRVAVQGPLPSNNYAVKPLCCSRALGSSLSASSLGHSHYIILTLTAVLGELIGMNKHGFQLSRLIPHPIFRFNPHRPCVSTSRLCYLATTLFTVRSKSVTRNMRSWGEKKTRRLGAKRYKQYQSSQDSQVVNIKMYHAQRLLTSSPQRTTIGHRVRQFLFIDTQAGQGPR